VSPELLSRVLRQGDFAAVGFVYNETSTAVMQDIAGLGHAASEAGVLSIVDTVSIMGGAPIDMDGNGIDAVIGGSQKALMLPPGLSFVALSDRAVDRARQTTSPRYYFDLLKALAAIDKGQTPYTPAVTLINGLREALRLIDEEGLDTVFARHRALGAACRAALQSMGLELLVAEEARASVTVTAARMPEGLDSGDLVARGRDDSRILISGGQDTLKGKIFRIGHLGDCRIEQLVITIAAVGSALNGMGVDVDADAAVDAARDEFNRCRERADA
jgi:aspartate aminotransferase-like enzyme